MLKSIESDGVVYTLLDKNGIVILTNRKNQTLMTPLQRPKGELVRLDDQVSQWSPQAPPGTPFYVRFRQSVYIIEAPVGALTEWTLVLEKPMAPVQKALGESYTRRLGPGPERDRRRPGDRRPTRHADPLRLHLLSGLLLWPTGAD